MSAVIQGPYFHDLMAQPAALRATHAWLAAPGRWQGTRGFLEQRPWRRIVLTGMGSSFHSCHPLLLSLVAAGHAPVMIETSELVHYAPALCDDEHALVVAVSQSGASAEVVRLLGGGRRCAVLGVTNTADSALARTADHVLLAQAGAESTVSCKTYVAGLMLLQWLATALVGGEEQAALAALAPAAGLCGEYLQQWPAWVAQLEPRLRGIEHLFVVGRGPSMATAGTGALILKESTRLHAEGMGCAAFRHGPLEMLRAGMLLLVLEGDARTAPLNAGLAREMGAPGPLCELVGPSAALPALRLPADAPGALRPILEILPLQMASLALAALAGREAGRFERATKVTDRE